MTEICNNPICGHNKKYHRMRNSKECVYAQEGLHELRCKCKKFEPQEKTYNESSHDVLEGELTKRAETEKGCGDERPVRKTFCQLFEGHQGSHQAVIYWEDENKPQNYSPSIQLRGAKGTNSQQGSISNNLLCVKPADNLVSKRRKIEFLPIMEKDTYYYLEQDIKEFIKGLKERLCLEGFHEGRDFCNHCLVCRYINEIVGKELR